MAEKTENELGRKDREGISRRDLLQRSAMCLGAVSLPEGWKKLLGLPGVLQNGPVASPAAGQYSDPEQSAPTSFHDVQGDDRWQVIGPGGGGGVFNPTISPHDTRCVLVSCDMTGAYISHDGASSWSMFNLGGSISFFLFDPVDPKVIYAKTSGGVRQMASDRSVSSAALFRSADSGSTWSLVRADSATKKPVGSLTALAVDPADSATLYAAFQQDREFVLRVSHDLGRHWGKPAELANGAERIFVDPRSPKGDRTVYVIGAGSVMVREGGGWRNGKTLKGAERLKGQPDLLRRFVSGGFPEKGGKLVVYMSVAGKVYVSDDGGESWRESPLPRSFFPLVASSVATSLGHPDVAYVSYRNHRRGAEVLYGTAVTTDRGRSWKLAWKESTTNAPNIHGSWLSKDFGPGWGGNPIQLGVAPTDPKLCFGGDDGRLMGTTDGGRIWKAYYSRELPNGTYTTNGLNVTSSHGVHFDPFNPQRIFISYTDIGLFRSEDGGKSWSSSIAGVPVAWSNTTYWIVFDPKVRGRVWGVMSGVHDLPRPKMWAYRSPATFDGGVCRSDDGGRSWRKSNDGMPQTAATYILLDPQSPTDARVLYVAGLGRGVFKSTDSGHHWVLKNQGITEQEPFAWRLVRASNGVLYLVVARRSDNGSIGGEGDGALYRSTDGAERWTRIQLPEGCNGPEGLAVDPRDPQRLYLAAWSRRLPGRTGGYVLVSSNGGYDWREALAKDQHTYVGGGVFLSTDGGRTWRHVLTRDAHIYDVTVDPGDPRTLYACGFESSAWRSNDRGVTWKRIKGFNFKWGQQVILDPNDPRKVYITTYGSSVWHGPAETGSQGMEQAPGGGFKA